LNFPRHEYVEFEFEIETTATAAYVANLRRSSTGFSRGASRFRGVTRHHQHGRWEARIGRVLGNRYLYLGTFSCEEDAARAYDVAALHHRGPKAVTNFNRESYGGSYGSVDARTRLSPLPRFPSETVAESALEGAVRAREDSRTIAPGNLRFDAFSSEPLTSEVVHRKNASREKNSVGAS
jgi:AP2-like factor (ANT lineage)